MPGENDVFTTFLPDMYLFHKARKWYFIAESQNVSAIWYYRLRKVSCLAPRPTEALHIEVKHQIYGKNIRRQGTDRILVFLKPILPFLCHLIIQYRIYNIMKTQTSSITLRKVVINNVILNYMKFINDSTYTGGKRNQRIFVIGNWKYSCYIW